MSRFSWQFLDSFSRDAKLASFSRIRYRAFLSFVPLICRIIANWLLTALRMPRLLLRALRLSIYLLLHTPEFADLPVDRQCGNYFTHLQSARLSWPGGNYLSHFFGSEDNWMRGIWPFECLIFANKSIFFHFEFAQWKPNIKYHILLPRSQMLTSLVSEILDAVCTLVWIFIFSQIYMT